MIMSSYMLTSFRFSHKQTKSYWWAQISKRWYIQWIPQEFKMSFIIGISKDRLYGLMRSSGIIDATITIEFIKEILEVRQKVFNNSDRKAFIVWNNTSIHKSSNVKEFVEGIKIKILIIWPYCSSLNPVENLILFIKSKIRQQQNRGR